MGAGWGGGVGVEGGLFISCWFDANVFVSFLLLFVWFDDS